ncbi:hypothetical protein SAMN04490178_13720 [Propionispora vibrioides]|jgi:hypothetical protein|uniref:Uncharacterized protein n=1 Tax=Propionispora vibrioides TaxID=112903 RepID=A0A1H8Y1Q2_9FIRM|nr:hypothetical protein SAMN04490178_13720 [Propionispora vibrioides]
MANRRKKQVVCPACKSRLKEVVDANGAPDLVCVNETCKFSVICQPTRTDGAEEEDDKSVL